MASIHKKLETLYDLLVDNFTPLAVELKTLIAHPERIDNTNKFASLLSELKNSTFIDPLLLKISQAERNSPWLGDFLYAVINLLEESSIHEEYDIPEQLIHRLEDWLLHYKDEISWKSADLLKFYHSATAERIQLTKLEERGDFFMTYAACLNGLLRYNKEKHWPLMQQIATDPTRDEELRELAHNILENYQEE